MKWSRILICSIYLITFFVIIIEGQSQNLEVRAGIYDFTDNTATEFYTIAPGIFVDYDVVSFKRLKLNTGAGFAISAINYNDHKHYLYFFPVFLSMKYTLVNPDSRLKPSIGAGFSLAGKIDQNKDFDKSHYAFTYGYHLTGILKYQLKDKLSVVFDLRYNLLLNPVMEEINMSGVVSTIGVEIRLKK